MTDHFLGSQNILAEFFDWGIKFQNFYKPMEFNSLMS